MTEKQMNLIFETQERFFSGAEHQALCNEYEQALVHFRSVLQSLPEAQQEAIGDFVYLSEKVHYQLMALALDKGAE